VDGGIEVSRWDASPSITLEMAKGFSLYMIKAIMSGRVDEIIDLAESNLWR